MNKTVTLIGGALLATTLFIGSSDYAKGNDRLVFAAGAVSAFLTGLGLKTPGQDE